MFLPRKLIAVLDKLLGLNRKKKIQLTRLPLLRRFSDCCFFVFMLLLDTVLTSPILLSVCEGKMTQLGGLSNIRAF